MRNLITNGETTLFVDNKKYSIKIKDDPECSKACPAGVNVKAYINLIANKRFEEAVDVIREDNPFPAICGRVCNRPCEDNCEQGLKGDSVQIRALKRFACDYELARRPINMEPCKIIHKEKIAIIGAGPAGLSAAVDLIRKGYFVNVFEAEKEPGGMLRYAIPSYRLPKRILKREIDWIKDLGVNINTEKKINNPGHLLKKGYSAVLIAQGSSYSIPMGIEGEKTEGVIDPLLFLKKINTKKSIKIDDNIVVIGGGSTAFDVARSAVRLGAKKVTIAYRRGMEEMPAESEEIEDAEKEGIEIKTLLIPKRIIEKNRKVNSIEFLKAKLGKPDESGRRRPIPIINSELVIKADIIFPAVGSKPNIESFEQLNITNNKNRIEVKEGNQTRFRGIFAAGDVEKGPSYVVEAIKEGHIAAKGIDSYLKGKNKSTENSIFNSIPIVEELKEYTKSIYYPNRVKFNTENKTFDEVEKSFIDFEAVDEASRCFNCGSCNLCTICLPNCDNKQLIAKIDDKRFLLKVPSKLSYVIYDKDDSTYDINLSNDLLKSINLRTLIASVNSDLCISCGRCEEVCAYRAIRNIFIKNKPMTAEVDHDSCASCSACVSACPTGAISQGYMSDDEILLRLYETKTLYPGVKALMSYWSTPTNSFEDYNGVVEIMSARKPSPSFLIRALTRSGRGLLVIGPDKKSGSHYLSWEEHPSDIVEKTRGLLKIFGISQDRIQYKAAPDNTDPHQLLKDFSKDLDDKKLNTFKVIHPKIKMNPINESIMILRFLSANPDSEPYDDIINVSPVKKEGIAFFEGCLPLINNIGLIHKLFDISSTRISIHKLLKKAGIVYGVIPGFLCPSNSLLESDIDKTGDIVKKIAEKNLQSYKKIDPDKLILGTPESFNTFSKLKEYKNIESLPNILYNKLKNSKGFYPIKKTVAIHSSCHLKKDPFIGSTKKLIKLIPGISIVELEDKCCNNGFTNLNVESKESVLKILSEANEKDVDTIICTSPNCESHFLLCQRKGSWLTTDIEITDVYSILMKSLNDGDKI
ncbi:FAD-dependent oxidoreductase [Thermoplasmatota archaeon]